MTQIHPTKIQRALLSVTDKTGIVDLARGLVRHGIEILSTGGTKRVLEQEGVPVTAIEQFTGVPEMLDGRVKTLHPRVHGGILARRDLASHREQVALHKLDLIDLVAVNLYDFQGALARTSPSFEEIIEEIDIGGPTLLRAAAKNHAFVLPVVDPQDYPKILAMLDRGEEITAAFRRSLAGKVYAHTARYDHAIAAFFERSSLPQPGPVTSDFPERLERSYLKVQDLRYGENPHQRAAFYRDEQGPAKWLSSALVRQGKELSYNNLLDLDSALALASDVGPGTTVYVKHNNPCGVARASDPSSSIRTARAVDPVSAFGAVVAVHAPIDRAAAAVLTETFLEAVIAPSYELGALELLAGKKNLRVLELGSENAWRPTGGGIELRPIRGGVLAQDRDEAASMRDEVFQARVVTDRAPDEAEMRSLAFSWTVAKHVRSNAIVFGREDRIVAVGAGQMSRIDSVKICQLKAGELLKGCVVASDAFFPFRDGLDALIDAGATAVVQPGGSVRDDEVILAANERGVAMLFTGFRHFRH